MPEPGPLKYASCEFFRVQKVFRLAFSVYPVDDSVTDDVLEEHLQHSTRLLVDENGDALHNTSDSELGNTLDVITGHLAMASPFPRPLPPFLRPVTFQINDALPNCKIDGWKYLRVFI